MGRPMLIMEVLRGGRIGMVVGMIHDQLVGGRWRKKGDQSFGR
jgi:hypothetical protein